MTDSSSQTPPNNKKPPIYAYRGPQKEYTNIFFSILENPVAEGDEWKSGEEKQIFLHSLDREIQSEAVKGKFCTYSMGSPHDLSGESVKVGNEGFGGVLGMFSEQDFKKYFIKLGK